MSMKKIALAAGLAGTMTGCYTYYPAQTVVTPTTTTTVAPAVVAPAVVAPTVVIPAYRSYYWWGPRFYHHHHWRYRW